MPNLIDANGLQTATYAELITKFTTAFKSIYGPDINLDSDSPDGQMMGIFVQCALDNIDLLVQINSGFDPDQAIGTILDQRIAINGIQRQQGTFTLTNITLTTDRALNLSGLDGSINDPNGTGFTVSDNAGNKWVLAASQTISVAGTYVYSFRAQNTGAVLTTPNTITVPVTVLLGVTSVNNPTTYTSLGFNEETDAAVRIRRQKSVSLASQGYLAGLLAALQNITGVTAAFVYENVTGSTDGDSIPGHSIWAIVQGGATADIASAIYTKRNAGCGMKGSTTSNVTQKDGTLFQIKWDVVSPENLFIKFNATSINGTDSINSSNIATQLALTLTPGVYATVDINELATLVQKIDPNCLVTGAGFSTASLGSYTNTLRNTAKNKQWAVASGNIAITIV